MKFLAKTLDGLEECLAEEIRSLGGKHLQIGLRNVEFEGTLETLYKVNLWSRTAIHVLVPITTAIVNDEEELYAEIHSLPWDKIFDIDQTFSVHAAVSSDIFTHSKYAALKSKDAIVDKFRRKYKRRPNVNVINPHISIDIHIKGNELTVSLDSSGESLHKRGYRIYNTDAPLNEALAAGIIYLSGWDKKTPFCDPMCGSGTLAIEAALMSANIPPRTKKREYLFKNWPNYNATLWDNLLETAFSQVERTPAIMAGDKSIQAMNSTKNNAQEAGVLHLINTERQDFFKTSCAPGTTIIMNPPYDERIKINDVNRFYKEIGDHLKQYYIDCEAWIFSGNIDAIKSVGLRPNKKFSLFNGAIPSKLFNFGIYEGSLTNDEEE